MTFAPGQPSDDTLMVPIDLQALVVGFGAGIQSVPTETVVPNTAPNSPEAATLPQAPPLFAQPFNRPSGVHLSWAMPDALTRGDAGSAHGDLVPAGNPAGLPALPDRWVVVRMVHGTTTVRSWVLLADRAERRDMSAWTAEPGVLPPGTIVAPTGKRYYEQGKLTATAGADVAWAATFDAVLNRFSFFDDLADVPGVGAQFSYLVIGWWTNPAVNPLHGTIGIAPYEQRMAQLSWDAPFPYSVLQPPAPETPPFVILHGQLCGLTRQFGFPDRKPDAALMEFGVGGTGLEAFAGWLAGGGTDAQRAAIERAISAFGSGLLARIDTPDGLAAADAERHGSAFIGVSGGMRPETDTVADGDPFRAPTRPSAPPPPPHSRWTGATLQHRDAHDVLEAVSAVPDPAPPRFYRQVETSEPRTFVPADPALLVVYAGRSQRHGGDTRFTTGRLRTRLSHDLVIQVGTLTEAKLPAGLRTLGSNRVPKEVDWLLREAVLVDPFRASERAGWAASAHPAAAEARMRAEVALRHPAPGSPLADDRDDDGRARALRTALLGADPDPLGVLRWKQAWVPLWCEWELGLRMDGDLARWTLGAVDLESATPDAGAEVVVAGRTLLTAAVGQTFAGQVRAFLDEENRRDNAGIGQVTEAVETALSAAAFHAEGTDLLAGTFAGIRETLLGLDPRRSLIVRIDAAGRSLDKPRALALPRLLAGGSAAIRRLRIVDAFGRFVDAPSNLLGQRIKVATTHRHPAGPPRFRLAPRFQRPSRVNLRLVDPRPGDREPPVEASVDQEHPELAISPVAGWLLPDHVDEALECFDARGRPLGQLRNDDLSGAVVWEGAPGRPGPIGGPPDPGDEPGARHVTRFANGVVQADAAARRGPLLVAESALSALLRGVDTTLWTIDPLGSVGTSAIAGLVGRPIAVLRGLLRLDVESDVGELSFSNAAAREARARAFAELAAKELTVRLGELTRTDDGLLAFFVEDDYAHARLVAPEVHGKALASGRRAGQLGVLGSPAQATPPVLELDHPYVAGRTDVRIRRGQTLRLTLLVTPGGKIHVTSGVLPRKDIALARDWFHRALEGLSPSFRVGPVLVDPTSVRMPRVTGLGESQAFTYRDTPLSWRDDPILAASQTALLPDDPAGLKEGWIRVVPAREDAP